MLLGDFQILLFCEPAAELGEGLEIVRGSGKLKGGLMHGFGGSGLEHGRGLRVGNEFGRVRDVILLHFHGVTDEKAVERGAVSFEAEAVRLGLGELLDGFGVAEGLQPVVDLGLLIFG